MLRLTSAFMSSGKAPWLPGEVDRIRASITNHLARRNITLADWARRAKLADNTVRNLMKGKTDSLTMKSIQKLAAAENLTVAQLMQEAEPAPAAALAAPSEPAMPPGAMPGAIYSAPDLPILGTARGGIIDTDRMLVNEHVAVIRTYRPVYLVGIRGAYAVNVVGDSMEPAFRQGHLAYVDPSKAPRPGDDVVVIQKTGEWFVKQLMRRTARAIIARQHNPSSEIEYPTDTVLHVHLIVGSTRVDI